MTKKITNLCGSRIKEKRNELGMYQVDLAAILEIEHGVKLDRSDISEIERGVRAVKDFELHALAEILGVTLEWLLQGDESADQLQKSAS